MAGSVNKVILVGNLGADPEIRRNRDGDPIANISIATSESWRDKNSGEKREKTEWHQIVVFGGLAKVAEQYLKKGTKVYVEGKLQTREWEKDGVKRYTTEIVLQNFRGELHILSGGTERDDRGSRESDRNSNRRSESRQENHGSGGGFGGGGFGASLDDTIPFEMSWR